MAKRRESRRSGEAVAAQHRKAGPMKHKLTPRGGAKDDQADLLSDAECEHCTGAPQCCGACCTKGCAVKCDPYETELDVKGKWRCAACECVYDPKDTVVKVKPYPACPHCGEAEDVFEADDGCWDGTEVPPVVRKDEWSRTTNPPGIQTKRKPWAYKKKS